MNKKIKLLHITTSLKVGGAEAVLCDLIAKLGNEEFEHHVIYFHHGPNVARLQQLGIKTYQVAGFVWLYDPTFLLRLFFKIRKLKPDVIHSLLWMANVVTRVISWVLKIPNLSVYHNDIDQDGRFWGILDKATRHLSTKIVAVSSQVVDSLQDPSIAKKIDVISNGIDVAHIRGAAEKCIIQKEDLGISPDSMVIGSVGRLCSVKNFPILLKGFALLKKMNRNVYLVIVGEGDNQDELKALACELGITDNVRFIIGKQAYGYYPLFDVFVQCSEKEGVSIALLEAMSFSIVPIVASMTEDHPVIRDRKNGIVVKASDAAILAQVLADLIDQKDTVTRLGEQASESVEKQYSSCRMAEKYKKIFTSMPNRNIHLCP